MKKFEIILGSFATLSIILKLLQIPGGGALTVITLSSLSVFYYIFSFALINGIALNKIFKKISYKDTNGKRIIGAIVFGWCLSTLLIGGLFKLQFYTGATFQLSTGLIWTSIVLFLAAIFYFRNKIDYYKKVFSRTAIIGSFGLLMYLTPYTTLVDIYYGDTPDYAELYKRVLADPENQGLRKQLNQMELEMWEEELRGYNGG